MSEAWKMAWEIGENASGHYVASNPKSFNLDRPSGRMRIFCNGRRQPNNSQPFARNKSSRIWRFAED